MWKPIKSLGYRYAASDKGEIKNLKTGCIRKKRLKKGYEVISMNKNGKRIKIFVHRLVCEAFHKNPENKPQVNHKDGNKLNNRPDNLEWCTQKENNAHCWANGYRNSISISGSNNVGAKHTWEQIREIGSKYRRNEYGYKKLGNEYGENENWIRSVIVGKIWKEY